MSTNIVRFKCPHCKQRLEAPAEMAGENIDCPECKGLIIVPSPEQKEPTVQFASQPVFPATNPQSSQPPGIVISQKTLVVAGIAGIALIAVIVSIAITAGLRPHKSETQVSATISPFSEQDARNLLDEYMKAWCFGKGDAFPKATIMNVESVSVRTLEDYSIGVMDTSKAPWTYRAKIRYTFKHKSGELKTSSTGCLIQKETSGSLSITICNGIDTVD